MAASVFTPVWLPVQMARMSGPTFFSRASRSPASAGGARRMPCRCPPRSADIIGPVVSRAGLGIWHSGSARASPAPSISGRGASSQACTSRGRLSCGAFSSHNRDMTHDAYDVAIIGAGHNGLTCAAYLAGAGLARHRAREECRRRRRGGDRGVPSRLPQLGGRLHGEPAQPEGDRRSGAGRGTASGSSSGRWPTSGRSTSAAIC